MTAASERAPLKAGFREDIEGLRAVAVLVVLLYHAGVPFVRGGYVGVDAFFVISGFLITGLLLRELEGTGRISLARFYSRRAKRLLPLTVVVLLAVVALSWALYDPVRGRTVAFDVISAGIYVMNWRLAIDAADYFGAGLEGSPVQHFWTLAVEEQFYLAWPLLLLVLGWWCKRTGRGLRPVAAIAFGVVLISSLAYGIYSTGAGAGGAYFSTLTRAWELALGGMLALAPAALLRFSRPVAGIVAGAGLAAVLASAGFFGDRTPFPGTAALLPTLGTAGVIAAGFAPALAAPSRLLTLAPVRHVGRISYSWYLWHWPPLVFAEEVLGELTLAEGLAIVAASYAPAALTHRLIERPLIVSETLSRVPRNALALGAACTSASLALGVLLFATTPSVPELPENRVAGAAALLREEPMQNTARAVHPAPAEATAQRSEMDRDGCHAGVRATEPGECVYGDPSSGTTVALLGDSHASQWFAALNRLAEERGWRLIALGKGACPPAEASRYNSRLRRQYTECDDWRENAIRRITEEEQTDLVVTSMRNPYGVLEDGKSLGKKASEEALEEGYVATLQRLRDSGARVAVIGDIPHPKVEVPECVSRYPDELRKCATSKRKALGYPRINAHAARRVEGVRIVDPTPVVCPEETCPAVIGNALVYRNGAHLTQTYVRTLAPWLGERLPEPVPPTGRAG